MRGLAAVRVHPTSSQRRENRSCATMSTCTGTLSPFCVLTTLEQLSLDVMRHGVTLSTQRDIEYADWRVLRDYVHELSVRQSSSRWRGRSSLCWASGEGSDLKLEAKVVRSSVRVCGGTRPESQSMHRSRTILDQHTRPDTESISWVCCNRQMSRP